MAIGGVSGTSSSTQTTSADDAAQVVKAGSNGLQTADFMKLLVAQLKNQDPNNPLDTKELVTQLSQLTSVEQLVTIGDKMQKLTTATNGMAANQSAGLIGKTVQGMANTAQLTSTGGAKSAVTLGQGAVKATVSVTNDAGRVVKTFDLDSTNAGPQTISWDGSTTTGDRATAGTYTFSVDAKDKNNTPVDTDMSVTGIVTGVDYDTGTPELVVGNTRVPLTNITSITQ
jgi:flagellar basal-body rod modification protein FlgD